MKKYLNSVLSAILLVAILFLASCQKEDALEEQVDAEQTIVANSTTASLIARIAINDGSGDNIVDGSSCFDISFPYKVVVNGDQLTINSHEDFKTIEAIFDAVLDDEDQLEIIFPIVVTTTDYTEITVESSEDLRSLSSECVEGGADEDIECLDIIYPIELFSYNDGTQETTNVSVTNDKDLGRFFAGLNETDLISFKYPIAFELYDGSELVVNSNSELVATIEQVTSECDEDDDNDYNDDDFTNEELENWLTECEMLMFWQLERDNVPNVAEYQNSRLKVVSANEGSTIVTLELDENSYSTGYTIEKTEEGSYINVTSGTVTELISRWWVNKISEQEIRLTNADGLGIVVRKNCEENFIEELEENAFIEKLTKNSWLVDSCLFGGENQFDKVSHELNFKADGSVELYKYHALEEGTWQVKTNSDGNVTQLYLSIGQEEMFNFTYTLTDITDNRLIFGNYNATEYRLILQESNDLALPNDEVLSIEEILMQGGWKIASVDRLNLDFDERIKNLPIDFMERPWYFLTDETIPEADMHFGRYYVTENRELDLSLYLDFGPDQNGQGILTGAWTIFKYSDSRIELKALNIEGTLDTAVIEKQ